MITTRRSTTAASTYPLPRTSVCTALAKDSIVVGADGNHYRCGLQVGEKNRPVAVRESNQQMRPASRALLQVVASRLNNLRKRGERLATQP
jgi:uncharacterized protein